MSYDDEYALMRARVFEERGVIPWNTIAIPAPQPINGDVPAVTAREIVTLAGPGRGIWFRAYFPITIAEFPALVAREDHWYASQGLVPPTMRGLDL